jgi:uncharacterized protein YkwD
MQSMMQGSIRRGGGASARIFAALLLSGGLSSLGVACSDGGGSGDDDLASQALPGAATDMPPAEPGAASDGAGAPQSATEAAPNVTGLDGSGASEAGDTAASTNVSPVAVTGPSDVPAVDYCAAVADWDPLWVQFEEEVLLLVNERRSQPADCGEEGQFAAAAPLSMDPILRCSARVHSLDMFERDYFDHTDPDGIDPFERMAAAGFSGGGAGENIALGQRTPEEVMQAWMDSDGHCANVMRPNFAQIGVGYHPGAGQRGLGSHYWTQNFGAPPLMRGGGRSR